MHTYGRVEIASFTIDSGAHTFKLELGRTTDETAHRQGGRASEGVGRQPSEAAYGSSGRGGVDHRRMKKWTLVSHAYHRTQM